MPERVVPVPDAPVTKSLAEQVRDVLRARIVGGAVAPNSRLDLDALAAEFGISVTPVRDAVRSLESDGLVVIQPRKGVFTAPADAKAFKDVFDARIALECLAVETAVDRIPAEALDALAEQYEAAATRLEADGPTADEEAILGPIDSAIHDLIVQYCDNDVVRELMDSLRLRTTWARRVAAHRAHRYRLSFSEHRMLLEALRRRDKPASAELLRQHLTRARDHTLAALAASSAGDEAGTGPGN
jgi:DNA-binding GntR family transcriptional regulator